MPPPVESGSQFALDHITSPHQENLGSDFVCCMQLRVTSFSGTVVYSIQF